MNYLLKVENTLEGKSLIDFLKALKFVDIIDESDNFDSDLETLYENGRTMSQSDVVEFISASESSESINIHDAFDMSGLWLSKKN